MATGLRLNLSVSLDSQDSMTCRKNSEFHRNLRSHYESIIQEEVNKYKTEESYVKNAYISHPPNNTVLIATLYSV